MRKVGFSARKIVIALLSALMAICIVWAFVPVFGNAEGADTSAPSEITAKSAADVIENYRDKLVDDNIDGENVVPIVLSGTREEIAQIWSAALAKAKTKYVYLRLDSDWVAEQPEEGVAPVFGTGTGFTVEGGTGASAVGIGALFINDEKVILDLNGHVINRDLNNEAYAAKNFIGSVIYMNSSSNDFVIVDSNPTADHDGAYTYEEKSYTLVKTEYEYYSYIRTDVEKKTVTGGIITGGRALGTSQWGISFGGGIRMWLGNLNLFGGTVFGNNASINGAGIYIGSNGNVTVDGGNVIGNKGVTVSSANSPFGGAIGTVGTTSNIIIKSGKISANSANTGGAIYSAGVVEIQGGEVSHNEATNQGGALYASAPTSNFKLSKTGLVTHNYARQGGGVYSNVGSMIEVAGGTFSNNVSAGEGGAMFLNGDATLSGGTITKNFTNSYSGANSGIYFHSEGTLYLAGPVQLLSNGKSDYVYNDLSGSCKVVVSGDLKSGEGVDVINANIHIGQNYAPIKGYGEGNNKDDNNQDVDPSNYFHFNYLTNDKGYAMLTKDGVIYYTPFSTYYYSYNSETEEYDVPVTGFESGGNYGITFNYGEYGEKGLQVKVAASGVAEADADTVYFSHYYYEEGKETAESSELSQYDWSVTEVYSAGIYLGRVDLDNDTTVVIRIIIRPKSLNVDQVTVEADKADKEFYGKEITPEVTSVSINEWFENIEVAEENQTYRYDPRRSGYVVEYENNIHVAGKTYIVVRGVGNYGGEKRIEFKIVQPKNSHYEIKEWQYYDGTEWLKVPANSTPFEYNDTSRLYSVRALVKAMKDDGSIFEFDDGRTYEAYVYVANCSATDQKKGEDVTHTDPGLILGLGGKQDIFNADTYTITVECFGEELGNFALPTTDISKDLIVSPYDITREELNAATAEDGTSLLVVDGDGEYFPFLSEVEYVADNTVTSGKDKFGYVLYNGRTYEIVLNPDFKIDIDILGKSFINYVENVSYSHSVALSGQINKVVTVTTTISFAMNSNFSVEGGNTGSITKEWKIVTKNNSLAFGETESSFVYGTDGALALPEQGVAGNALYLTVTKNGEEVAKITVEGSNLYEYSEIAAGHKGGAIEGTLREYLDNLLLTKGIGNYVVSAQAADYTSKEKSENGAIYYAAPAYVNFTLTARSIEDGNGVTVEADDSSLVYNGNELEAVLTLAFGTRALVKDVDYAAVYANNVHAGTDTATVTVSGKGNYSGTVEITYSIAKADDNDWTVSLNIASWIVSTFNPNISKISGETHYGTPVFGIVVPDSVGLGDSDKEKLQNISVSDGVIDSALVSILNSLPVGEEYKLVAKVSETTDYNEVNGEFVFSVLKSSFAAPALNEIAAGNTQNTVYSGSNLAMNILGYNSSVMEVTCSEGAEFDVAGGTVYAVKAGTYTITVSIKDLYADDCSWFDGTTDSITLKWTIAPKTVKAPTAGTNSFVVNGGVQTFMPEGFDETLMGIRDNSKTDAGLYAASVYLLDTENYVWEDGTTDPIAIAWEIEDLHWLFVTIACILAGLALICIVCALGQFINHRARMRDLAEAEGQSADELPENGTEGGNGNV